MKVPLELIVPALADQLTAELYVPLPCTVASHCDVAPGATMEGLHVTEIEVTLDAGCTTTFAVPALLGSCALVAVTVTVPGAADAVNSPVGVMLPLLTVQETAEI